jgi:hypothetical protein
MCDVPQDQLCQGPAFSKDVASILTVRRESLGTYLPFHLVLSLAGHFCPARGSPLMANGPWQCE